ncbi:hypothetical protein K438DRAFT_2026557 [Mycena galopus ATCC 62051]|nr:hypothetical protein K438DRAFT_2026557 [Mycena galopus ATCC 62051]
MDFEQVSNELRTPSARPTIPRARFRVRVLRTPALPLLTHVHPLRTHPPSHPNVPCTVPQPLEPSLAPCPHQTPALLIHFERVPNVLPPLSMPALLPRIPLTSARFERPPTLPTYFERRHKKLHRGRHMRTTPPCFPNPLRLTVGAPTQPATALAVSPTRSFPRRVAPRLRFTPRPQPHLMNAIAMLMACMVIHTPPLPPLESLPPHWVPNWALPLE